MKDDFNSNEWGNIQLPGFNDEKLLDPNLNIKLSAQQRSNNPKWIEAQAKANEQKRGKSTILTMKENDPEAYALWKENHDRLAKELGSTEAWAETSRKNAQAQWEDPEQRRKKMAGIIAAWSKPEVLANKKRAAQEVAQRPDWKAKNLEKIMRMAKPVQDLESNIQHESLAAAARYYNIAVGTMQYWMNKSKKDKFFYIE
jgi:hypothetical protein